MKHVLLVGGGGAIGSIARYLCQKWFATTWLHPIPWATFIVNVTGCLLIGVFWGLSFRSFESNEDWKLFLMTGICGGFTTFSAFTLEGIGLLREQKILLFIGYVGLSVMLGLAATWLGMRVTR
jgi:fluoride exporter